MELEYMLSVIFILVVINLIGLGFYSANKNDFSAPLEFFRIKVNQANVCLSCDNIYHSSEQWCPLCFEKKFFVLRSPDCFPPLSSQKIKEVDKDGKIHYTLSLVGKAKSGFGPESDFVPDKFAKYSDPNFGKAQTCEQGGLAQDDCNESLKSSFSEWYDFCRIQLESKCRVFKGGNWFDASYAKLIEAIKRGFVLSGEEHTRRV